MLFSTGFFLAYASLMLFYCTNSLPLHSDGNHGVSLPSKSSIRADSPSSSISGCRFYNNVKRRGICTSSGSCRKITVNGGSPKAYLENAYCACSNIPAQRKANTIRYCLQQYMISGARLGKTNWTTRDVSTSLLSRPGHFSIKSFIFLVILNWTFPNDLLKIFFSN